MPRRATSVRTGNTAKLSVGSGPCLSVFCSAEVGDAVKGVATNWAAASLPFVDYPSFLRDLQSSRIVLELEPDSDVGIRATEMTLRLRRSFSR
ncbi:hypothetical protein J6590_019675 [Homalodisca vitripennis]|nr:hypothetical protein J6590_019675 [Homalodisca vitripennis]